MCNRLLRAVDQTMTWSGAFTATGKESFTRLLLLKQIESFDVHSVYNNVNVNYKSGSNAIDAAQFEITFNKLCNLIELEQRIWKWKVKNKFKSMSKEEETVILGKFEREKKLKKEDLEIKKDKKARDSVKENQSFKVEARVNTNHSILDIMFNKHKQEK